MKKILSKMRAAAERYDMIKENDRIAIGVSGGKDSLVLLMGLALMRDFYPNPYSIVAITIDPCFDGQPADYTQIETLCAQLDIKYVVRRTRMAHVIFEERKEKNPCSMCARMRRGLLHQLAQEHGCNRIALGHHEDDAVETFVMNLLLGGRLSCFAPATYLSRRDLWMIRPMIFCSEQEIASAARRLSLPIVKSACSVDGETARQTVKQYISDWEQRIPDIKAKIIGAMERAGLNGWKSE